MNKRKLSLVLATILATQTTYSVNPFRFITKRVAPIAALAASANLLVKHYEELKPATKELFENLKNENLTRKDKAKLVATYLRGGINAAEDDILKFTKNLVDARIAQKKHETVKTELEVIREQQAKILEILTMLEEQVTKERRSIKTEATEATVVIPPSTFPFFDNTVERLEALGCKTTQAKVDALLEEQAAALAEERKHELEERKEWLKEELANKSK